jgi:hypothetical protein
MRPPALRWADEAARARHSGKEREVGVLYRSALRRRAVIQHLGFELADDADGLEHGGGVALGDFEVGPVPNTLDRD